MSVLQRKELEASPLADLHVIASELGLESFRSMRKADLIAAIVGAQGGEPEASEEESSEPPAPSRQRTRRRTRTADRRPRDADSEPEAPAEDEPAGEADPEEPAAPEEPDAPEEIGTGVLDVLPNGSGFVRVDPSGQSRDDIYVSPAQIRRCELRAGDQVGGPIRPPRRNERHPSLTRVDSVNGRDAEPPEERPSFDELTAVFARERLPAPDGLDAPFGKGSRVAIGGPPAAGATRLLRDIASTLSGVTGLELSVALVGVRPEEVGEWRSPEGSGGQALAVSGGGFDQSLEAQVQLAELAIERGKRVAERGGEAAVLIDSLEVMPAAAARRLFGAARNLDGGGSLTVVATTGLAWEAQRYATTRVMLDPPPSRSGTLREDLLG